MPPKAFQTPLSFLLKKTGRKLVKFGQAAYHATRFERPPPPTPDARNKSPSPRELGARAANSYRRPAAPPAGSHPRPQNAGRTCRYRGLTCAAPPPSARCPSPAVPGPSHAACTPATDHSAPGRPPRSPPAPRHRAHRCVLLLPRFGNAAPPDQPGTPGHTRPSHRRVDSCEATC